MGQARANCMVCGQPLEYFEVARPVTCIKCGRREEGRSICVEGHYVCDGCHRTSGVERIAKVCRESSLRNPIALAQQIMDDPALCPNGPEHHALAGAVLLCTYRNSGGAIDLEAALDELCKRSLQVPGGACGFWGCCGAAISAGQFHSIATAATPLSREPWGQGARLVSRILGRIAEVDGPRCCKRTTFLALDEAVKFCNEFLGVAMEVPDRVECAFMAGNPQCLGRHCPFYPAGRAGRAPGNRSGT